MNTLLTLPFARSSDRARQCQTATISQKHHRETNRDTIKTDKVARAGLLRNRTNTQRDKLTHASEMPWPGTTNLRLSCQTNNEAAFSGCPDYPLTHFIEQVILKG